MELLGRVASFAEKKGDAMVHRFVERGEVVARLSYGDLEAKSSEVAQHLAERKGDRIILMYPPGLEFIVAFYGCLKSAVIAVPAYPVDVTKKHDVDAATAIVRSSGANLGLTSSAYRRYLRTSDFLGIPWLTTDRSSPPPPRMKKDDEEHKAIDDDEDDAKVAFLQYTSGSTSSPRGVMIGVGNLNHNLRAIQEALKSNELTINVSWLPVYHDMGLIGSYLGTAYCGGTGYAMSPVEFIRRPYSWVELLSQTRATHTQAPSFAFGLVARKAWHHGDPTTLDLSALEHVINAAEPVRASDIDSFCRTFPTFKPSAMRPTYGLAEHTVFVSSNGTRRLQVRSADLADGKVIIGGDDDDVTTLFGCGRPPASIEVKIIKDSKEEEEVPPWTIGEVWIASPSTALGYWNNREETTKTFRQGDGASYLRTGDLGFLTEDGEVVICGRIKDMMIVRGKNHYPQDLEKTAETASRGRCRAGCSAAFQVDAETVALVVERKSDEDDSSSIIATIEAAVADTHGVRPQVLVAEPRTVPKTTSGKISRSTAKRRFLSQIDSGGPQQEENRKVTAAEITEKRQRLAAKTIEEVIQDLGRLMAKVLKQDAVVNEATTVGSLGLGSMEGLHLVAEIEQDTAVDLDPDLLWQDDLTLGDLAWVLKRFGDPGPRPFLLDGAGLFLEGGDLRKHTLARAKARYDDTDVVNTLLNQRPQQKKKKSPPDLNRLDKFLTLLLWVTIAGACAVMNRRLAATMLVLGLWYLQLPAQVVAFVARRLWPTKSSFVEPDLSVVLLDRQKRRRQRPCLAIVVLEDDDVVRAAAAVSLYPRIIFLSTEKDDPPYLLVINNNKPTLRLFDLAAHLVIQKDHAHIIASGSTTTTTTWWWRWPQRRTNDVSRGRIADALFAGRHVVMVVAGNGEASRGDIPTTANEAMLDVERLAAAADADVIVARHEAGVHVVHQNEG